MSKGSCVWPAGCDRPRHGRGLCKKHWQAASRRGWPVEFVEARKCEHCAAILPPDSRTNRRFCSPSCVNAHAWATCDKQIRARQNKEWRDATAPARAAKSASRRLGRRCVECQAPLPETAGGKRRFCDRSCINRAAIRDRRESRRAGNERYRARRLGAAGPGVDPQDWAKMLRRFDYRCAYCDVRTASLTKDHVVPLIRGGQDAIGNILPACKSCNSRKKHRLLVEWRMSAKLPT